MSRHGDNPPSTDPKHDRGIMNEIQCRFCETPLTEKFVDLGVSPVSNDYLKPEQLMGGEMFYPLAAYVCPECFLVQLPEYKSAKEIFNQEYAYFSSYSSSWLEHARRYVEDMCERFGYGPDSLVIELASNDGYLLQYFKEKGVPVLGVEPSANVATYAREERDIPTLIRFFGVETAQELAAEGRYADLLLGNNVLAHVPDINDFVGGMKIVLKERGVITMEFPHLLRLIEQNQFDTIYHEHFSYLSLGTVQQIFAHHGLTLFDVQELPTHGGSLRIFARHAENEALPVSDAIAQVLEKEARAGLRGMDRYRAFQPQVDATKQALLEFLIEAKRQDKTVVGYGAPAKGNTLLNYCGVRTDFIDYTVDRSPHKQGRFLPGTRIPIHAPERIGETRPDYVLILPWNLEREITGQLAYIREWGGKFVVPIPTVRVLD